MNEADLLVLLRDCYDPLMKRNIVETKLVRSAAVTLDPDAPGAGIRGVPPRYIVSVELHASSRDDTAAAQLKAQVENRLLADPRISTARVHLLPPLFSILS